MARAELHTLGEKMMGASAALEAAYRGAPADVVAGCRCARSPAAT